MKFFKLIAITFGLVFSMEILANPTFSDDLLREAENGDVLAQYNLGWVYDNGEGVIQNYEKAFE
jgi:TPR repeat protein